MGFTNPEHIYTHDLHFVVFFYGLLWVSFTHIVQGYLYTWLALCGVLLWFVMGKFYPHRSRLLQWHWGESHDIYIMQFRIASLALGQSYDIYHTLQDCFTGTGAIIWYISYTSGLLHWHWGNHMIYIIHFRIASLALGQSYDIISYTSGLLHWHWGNHMIVPVRV